jgi:hypothetical protein
VDIFANGISDYTMREGISALEEKKIYQHHEL